MSNEIKTFKDLLVWQKSMVMVSLVYRVTKNFPTDERYGLTSQIRRAAVSVPSNIAEGWMRNSPKYFAQFLRISLGSLGELETQIEIAKKEAYFNDVEYTQIVSSVEEVRKMLFGLISSLITDD